MITSEKYYTPNLAIHPGETLKGILSSLEMSQTELAKRTNLTEKTINEILKGKNPITTDTAIRFSMVFGMSASFWNNLESRYKETLSRLTAEKDRKKDLSLLDQFSCYGELAKHGYTQKTNNKKEKVLSLLKFFGVASLDRIPAVFSVAYRKSKKSNLSHQALAAWLRCGEIEAQNISVSEYNETALKNSLQLLRELTKENPKDYSKKITDICAACGVAVVFSPYFKKTYVNGATRWLSSKKALIQLSLRGRYSDIFWFAFFHELAHILFHEKRKQFIELEEKEKDENEKQADKFASNVLIPAREFKGFLESKNYSDRSIKQFADKIGISAEIVAGRLSKELNMWNRFSHLRKRLKLNTELT